MIAGTSTGFASPTRAVFVRRPRPPTRGFALLGAVTVLVLIALLGAWGQAAVPLAWLRDGSREMMAMQARAAADSGLALTVAILNEPRGTGAGCEALQGQGDSSWLDRHLDPAADGPGWVLRSLPDPSSAEIECTASANPAPTAPAWRCSCRAAGEAGPGNAAVAAAAGPPAAAFSVRWRSVPSATGSTVLGVESAGCVRSDGQCRRAPAGAEAASSLRQITLTGWPALVRLPASAMTAGGSIHLGPQVQVRNIDPVSGGRVLHAGQGVDPSGAVLEGLPGAPISDRVQQGDAALASQGIDSLAEGLLGLPLARWRAAPRVRHVDCAGAGAGVGADCAEQVQAWVRDGVQAVSVSGALVLPPGFSLGTAQRPVILVANGPLSLRGPGDLRGLVVAARIEADGRFGEIDWEGAAVTPSDLAVIGRVHMRRSLDVMEAAARIWVGVVPTPGSWREPLDEGTTP